MALASWVPGASLRHERRGTRTINGDDHWWGRLGDRARRDRQRKGPRPLSPLPSTSGTVQVVRAAARYPLGLYNAAEADREVSRTAAGRREVHGAVVTRHVQLLGVGARKVNRGRVTRWRDLRDRRAPKAMESARDDVLT